MLQKSVGPIRKSWIFVSPHAQKKQLGVMKTPIRGDKISTLHFYNNEVEAIPQVFFDSLARASFYEENEGESQAKSHW